MPEVVSLDPHTLGEVLGDVRTLAGATDAKDAGVDLVQDAAARIDRVRLAVRGAQPVRVAALEWLDPIYVAGHWTPQMIEYAGGLDVLGMPGEHSERRSWEEVAAARPEVVIVMPCGYDAERAAEEAYDFADELAELGARRIVAVDASAYFSRPGPRLIDGLELLAHVLHPDRLPEAPAGPGRDRALDGELRGGVGHRGDHGGDRDRRAHEHGRDRGAARLANASTASAASTPPIEAAEVAADRDVGPGKNVITRLRIRIGRRPEAMMSIPRLRAITIAAPNRPKIAVEAPTTGVSGLSSTAPNEPASSDGEVDGGEAHVAERRLEHAPEEVQRVHVQQPGGTARRAGSRRSAAATTRRRPRTGRTARSPGRRSSPGSPAGRSTSAR